MIVTFNPDAAWPSSYVDLAERMRGCVVDIVQHLADGTEVTIERAVVIADATADQITVLPMWTEDDPTTRFNVAWDEFDELRYA